MYSDSWGAGPGHHGLARDCKQRQYEVCQVKSNYEIALIDEATLPKHLHVGSHLWMKPNRTYVHGCLIPRVLTMASPDSALELSWKAPLEVLAIRSTVLRMYLGSASGS